MYDTISEVALRLVATYQQLKLPGVFVSADAKRLALLKEQLDLPPDLLDWYSVALPHNVEIPTRSLDIVLGDGEQLDQALLGYRFDAITGKELEDWDKTWLVIGGEGEYPLIIRTGSSNDKTVYCGSADGNEWQVKKLSADMLGFLLGLIEYINLFVVKYGRIIHDVDERLKPEFVQDFNLALNKNLSTLDLSRVWLESFFGYWI